MVFDTFATSGEYPTASSVGNVISVPLPTTVLIVPAAMPATTTASTSSALTRALSRPRSRGLQRLLRHDLHHHVAELAIRLGEPLAAQPLPHHGALLAARAGLAALPLALDEIARIGHAGGHGTTPLRPP